MQQSGNQQTQQLGQELKQVKPRLRWQFHLAFSASEVLAGVAVSDWPLPYAALIYRLPSFVIFVVQPVFQVITAELPSSFQVPVIPSPRVAFAAPPLDSVISNGCPAVSLTFHTPSKALAARAAKLVTAKKQGRRNGRHSCFPHVRTSLQERMLSFFPSIDCSSAGQTSRTA
jgi:hypothetical protein